MSDQGEEFRQKEKMDRIVEELEGLVHDALLSVLEQLQERLLRSRRLRHAQHPSKPYF